MIQSDVPANVPSSSQLDSLENGLASMEFTQQTASKPSGAVESGFVSVEELAEWLNQSFPTANDGLSEQRGIETAEEWSWEDIKSLHYEHIGSEGAS